jgi:hypothetical protein
LPIESDQNFNPVTKGYYFSYSKMIVKMRFNQSLKTKTSEIPITCRELRESDPTLPPGMQWIDPDEDGDVSIYVYCDMKSGMLSNLFNK